MKRLAVIFWLHVCRGVEGTQTLVEGTRAVPVQKAGVWPLRTQGDVLLQLDVTSHDGRALKLQLYREQVISLSLHRVGIQSNGVG